MARKRLLTPVTIIVMALVAASYVPTSGVAVAANATGGMSLFAQVPGPEGVTTDGNGNVYVSLNINTVEGLAQYSPNGVEQWQVAIPNQHIYGGPLRLATAAGTGKMYALYSEPIPPLPMQDGEIYTFDRNGALTLVTNLADLPVDASAVYDAQTQAVSPLFSGSIIQPQFTFGDIAAHPRQDGSIDLFVSGTTYDFSTSFVMRVNIPVNGAPTVAKVLVASAASVYPFYRPDPPGVAVAPDGTVLTTLPVKAGPYNPLSVLDVPVTFSADYDPAAGTPASPVRRDLTGIVDFTSRGITSDAAGNFYVVLGSGGTGSTFCGANSSSALVVVPHWVAAGTQPFDANDLNCYSPGQPNYDQLKAWDAATSPDGATAYMTAGAAAGGAVLDATLLPLPGAPVPPAAALNTATLPFAAEPLGTVGAGQTVTLANTSQTPLIISNVAIGGGNPADFTITSNTCAGTVPAGGNCAIGIAFAPAGSGSRSATLIITDNAPNSPQNVSLNGTGIDTQQTVVAAQQTAAAQQAAAQQTAAAQQIAAQQTATAQQVAAQQVAAQQVAAAQQTSAAQGSHTSNAPPTETPKAAPPAPSTPTVTPSPASATSRRGTTQRGTTGHPHSPAVSLIVQLLDKSVATGGYLRLRLRTTAHARISVTLQVLTKRSVMSGRGKRRKRVQRTVVLYSLAGHGATDGHGVLNGRLRVTYKPHSPIQAVVTVTMRTSRGTVNRTLYLTIRPPAHRH